MTKRLFRPKTAAIQLGISHSQFWVLVKRGDIKTFRVGKATFIEDGEIDRYIESIIPAEKAQRGSQRHV